MKATTYLESLAKAAEPRVKARPEKTQVLVGIATWIDLLSALVGDVVETA